MKTDVLSNIGELDDYELEHQMIRGYGFLKTPSVILKLYQMTKLEKFEPEKMEATKNFLEKKIKEGEIKPLTGIGFAIQSTDMLNVVRWDKGYPIVMNQILYDFENLTSEEIQRSGYANLFSTVKRLDLNVAGSFCVWENKISSHECTEWIKYLDSSRTKLDKEKYFSSFINFLRSGAYINHISLGR